MMQAYCKNKMIRNGSFVECGRVLRTDGGCDNENIHIKEMKAKKWVTAHLEEPEETKP